MNVAAADLNSIQQDLNARTKERKRLVNLWAVGSARLVRAVGAESLAKATPHFECKRRCAAAQLAVERASKRFMCALEASATSEEVDRLAGEHITHVQDFQAAQRELQRGVSLSEASLAAVAPYFEAEDEHRAQLSEADAEIEQLNLAASAAKVRYHGALRSLESLSEQAHRRRADTNAGAEAANSDRESPAQTPVSAAVAMSPQPMIRKRRPDSFCDESEEVEDRRSSKDSSSSAVGGDAGLPIRRRSSRAATSSAPSVRQSAANSRRRRKSNASPTRSPRVKQLSSAKKSLRATFVSLGKRHAEPGKAPTPLNAAATPAEASAQSTETCAGDGEDADGHEPAEALEVGTFAVEGETPEGEDGLAGVATARLEAG